jgi:phosphohistidine phosphatase SixA
LLVWLFGLTASVFSSETQTTSFRSELSSTALLEALRAGGLVVYIRHAETGGAWADTPTAVMGDCATQRNLNDQGRAQSRQIAQAWKRLRLPVSAVFSSEYCRCWQMAQIAGWAYQLEPRLSLPRSYPNVTDADRAQVIEHLRGLLGQRPAAGTNTVLISHGYNMLVLEGFQLGTQGEAVIFRPDGRGGYRLLARLAPSDWDKLMP